MMLQWVWWESDSEHHQAFPVWSGEGGTGFLWRGWSRVMRRIRELENIEIHIKQETGFKTAPTEICFGTAGCQQVHMKFVALLWGVFKTKIQITLTWNKRNGIGDFWKSCAASMIKGLVRACAAVAGERKPWGKDVCINGEPPKNKAQATGTLKEVFKPDVRHSEDAGTGSRAGSPFVHLQGVIEMDQEVNEKTEEISGVPKDLWVCECGALILACWKGSYGCGGLCQPLKSMYDFQENFENLI